MTRAARFGPVIASLLCAIALGCGPVESTSPRTKSGDAVRLALAEPDQLARAAVLLPVLERLGPENLDEVVAAYEQGFGTGAERGLALTLLMEAWVDLDPASAWNRVVGWPTETRLEAVAALLRPWARIDPSAAARAYTGLERKRLYKRGFSSLVLGWAESGESGIWEFVARMELGLDRENASRHVMEAVLRREGADALLRHIEELPDRPTDGFKITAFRMAGALVAGVEPAKAMAFAAKHADGPYDRMLVSRIGQQWAIHDGEAAMEWIQSLEPGRQRDIGMRETYRRWLIGKPDAARAWMRTRADDVRVAPIVTAYAQAVATDDPNQAVEWAQGISDPELRRTALVKIGGQWLRREPSQAQGRLEALGVYDAVLEAQREQAEKFKRPERLRRERRGAPVEDPTGAGESPADAPSVY